MLNGRQIDWYFVPVSCTKWAIIVLITCPGLLLAGLLMLASGFSFDGLAAIHVRELDYAQRNPASQPGYLLVEECAELRGALPIIVKPKGDVPQFLIDRPPPVYPHPTPFDPCLKRKQQEIPLDVLAGQWGQQLRQFYWTLVLVGALLFFGPFLVCWLIWTVVTQGKAAFMGFWQVLFGHE